MASAALTTDPTTLSPAQLTAYLARIGVDAPDKPDLATLAKLHRSHLMAFTWEAVDAFMGWQPAIEISDIFAKMVEGRRGGWCYEMNGLFGAALTALGYRVTRLCGCVDRPKLGDIAVGNHLTLQVDMDQPYLAEVGVADAFVEPVPLMAGSFRQRGFDFSISAADDGWLRFHNHPAGVARTVDFRLDEQDEAKIAAMQQWLMRDAGSPFTGALAIFRHDSDGYSSLQDRALRRVSAAGMRERLVTSSDEFADVLTQIFAIDLPNPADIWDKLSRLAQNREA